MREQPTAEPQSRGRYLWAGARVSGVLGDGGEVPLCAKRLPLEAQVCSLAVFGVLCFAVSASGTGAAGAWAKGAASLVPGVVLGQARQAVLHHLQQARQT